MKRRHIAAIIALGLVNSAVILAGVPVPALLDPLSPNKAEPGAATFTLVVSGTGFRTGAVVRWNGAALPSHVLSAAKIEAQVQAALVATAGTAAVTVSNKGGMVSQPVYFGISVPTNSIVTNTQVPALAHTGSMMEIMADVNGDGRPDLVFEYASGIDQGFGIALANGDGTYQAARRTQVAGGVSQFGISVADFNHDGKLDIALAGGGTGSNQNLYVYLGKGDGTFSNAKATTLPNGGVNFATADLDGDGNLDLVAANFSTATATVFLGKGDGTFTLHSTITTADSSSLLKLSDVNGDGYLDLVATNLSTNSLDVYPGKGDGTFGLSTSWPSGTSPNNLVVMDVNGDGKVDLITGSYLDHSASVLLGNGDGTFLARMVYKMPGAVGFTGIALADFDVNGTMDMIVTCPGSPSKVYILSGNGDGTFQPPNAGFALASGSSTGAIVVSDVNADGKPDLVIAPGGGTSFNLLIQQ